MTNRFTDKKARLLTKILFLTIFPLVFINEFFVYKLQEAFWNRLKTSTTNSTRILFVADPQIIGEQTEKFYPKSLAIWDSDTYLKKTFQSAVHFSQPHVICFLGDLFDEGSIATTEEFNRYTQRFKNIFDVDSSIKVIHIPGDNDIGGENGEPILDTNVQRFQLDLYKDDIFDYHDSIRFFKVSRLLKNYSNPDQENNKHRLRIGLSHIPLLSGGGSFLQNFLKNVDPNVIFSAHWHESKIYHYPPFTYYKFDDNTIKTFDLETLKKQQQYVEVMVPTASYRMGTFKVGYGVATIENCIMKYTVIWTWSRYLFLGLYAAWIFISLVLMSVLCCGRIYYSSHFRTIRYKRVPNAPDL